MATNKPGPTGHHPAGQLDPSDRGELAIGLAVDAQANRLIVNFGTPVLWLGLTKKAALGLAAKLQLRAAELKDEDA